jgi:NAD(P)H-flavin reductase
VTLHQLLHLSNHSKTVKIVLRVSKKAEQLTSLKSKIEFTKDYFNKRVVAEATAEGLSRVWICGPPKLSSDTATALLESGIKRESFLLL